MPCNAMILGRGTAWDRLGLACLTLVSLLALGGAAATPDGVLLAAPSAAGFVGVLAFAWLLRDGLGPIGLGLTPFLMALPFVAWAPGLEAWTGPPLLAPVLGVLVLTAWKRLDGPASRRALLPCLLVVYGLAAWRVQVQVGPEGDEPHYLMVAESLLRDQDLALEPDYAQRRYLAFYQKGELQPHYRIRGKGGEIYSLHAVGLSLLLLPAYALGGYPAASFFMALLLGLLVHQIRALLESWLGEGGPALPVAWLVGLSPPLVHYAGLIFSEVPAALLLALALRLGSEPSRLRGARLLSLAAALAFLPWLNVRHGVLAALALLHALSFRPGAGAAGIVLGGVSLGAAALAVYHWTLYGFFDPRRVYGSRPELSISQLAEGLPGLLLDQEFGLLVYAPVYALAAAGLVLLVRRRLSSGVAAAALVASAALLAGSWHMWRGGWNPPARFLVPVVPLLAAGVACSLRSGPGAPAALLAGWGLWTGLLGAWQPRLVHRDRDGIAPFFRVYSGAEEWTRLLPAYVLSDPDRHRLAALWGTALGGAALVSLRAPLASAGRVAATSAAAIAFAAWASNLSHSATGGRDAVRALGRAGLETPVLRAFGEAPARWTAKAIPWGPTYEPHRHAQGAPVGERLDLPTGAYRFVLRSDVLGDGAPELLVWGDRARSVLGRHRLRSGAEGLETTFEAHSEDGPVTLALLGGPPLILKELRLEPSTFGR